MVSNVLLGVIFDLLNMTTKAYIWFHKLNKYFFILFRSDSTALLPFISYVLAK